MKKDLILGFIFSLLISISGCRGLHTQGHCFDETVVSELENCKANKTRVLEILGTPELISETNPNKWYYLQRKVKVSSLIKPKIIEQTVLEIIFNKFESVEKINLIKNKHKENIKLTNEYTATYGTESNSIKNYWNSLGKFNKSGTSYSKKRR